MTIQRSLLSSKLVTHQDKGQWSARVDNLQNAPCIQLRRRYSHLNMFDQHNIIQWLGEGHVSVLSSQQKSGTNSLTLGIRSRNLESECTRRDGFLSL